MKRRIFLLSGSASAVLAATGCGGGGGGSGQADLSALADPADASVLKQKHTSTSSTTTTTTTTSSSTSTTTTNNTGTSTPTAAIAYPFGARLVPYAGGIRPTQSNSTMDTLLTTHYDAWKAARVVSASSVVAGGYAVQFSNTTYLTVSEGMGYGMLLTVLFAGHDAQARTLFDGMLAVARKGAEQSIAEVSG